MPPVIHSTRASKIRAGKHILDATVLLNQCKKEEHYDNIKRKRSLESCSGRNIRLGQQQHRNRLHIAEEGEEEREQRLQDLRERNHLRRSLEEEDNRVQRLVDQRHRTANNRRDEQLYRPLSYKAAASNIVEYNKLGPFNVQCIHCGALHFPEERVQNRVNPNSFGDCCLHGRINQPAPLFPNELALLFTRQHTLSKQFHEKIRNISSCFAFSSFNVTDDRTFNNKGIHSFTVGGQVYHKMNISAQPTENPEGEPERPRYGQMYFIDPEIAVTERMNEPEPTNQGINYELMHVMEQIMRTQNPFSQAYMMMREVVDENNLRAADIGIQPPHVHLVFAKNAGMSYDSRC